LREKDDIAMKEISISTIKIREIVDITDEINKVLKQNNVQKGLCHLFLPHSTAGLTTAIISSENELDLIDAFEVALPHFTDPVRKHEHSHIASRLPDHIISSFLGTSMAIPIEDNRLALGQFQRLVMVELNGPRKRTVLINFSP
jgi:secondary thiamine-phosphate synthase enzyme